MVVIHGNTRSSDARHQMLTEQMSPNTTPSTVSGRPLSSPPTQVVDEALKFPPQVLPLCPNLDLNLALSEALALEGKYQANLSLTMTSRTMNEITGRMRNGSCHVLRCLKVWYELPSDTFFLAVNTMDRFLTKMKAQPKHLSCIAVSAFHVSCEDSSLSSGCPVPTQESVSAISQSKCTPGDVMRMEDIIRGKLELAKKTRVTTGVAASIDGTPVTPLTMLRLMHCGILKFLASEGAAAAMPDLTKMVQKLEFVVCDTRASNFRACELSVVLLQREIKHNLVEKCLQGLYGMCNINAQTFGECDSVVKNILADYEGFESKPEAYHKQRLVWKLSNRTMRNLRPLNRLRKTVRMESLVECAQELNTEDVASDKHSLTKAEIKLRPRKGLLFFYGDNVETLEDGETLEDEPMEDGEVDEMEDCCEELSSLYQEESGEMEVEDDSYSMFDDMEEVNYKQESIQAGEGSEGDARDEQLAGVTTTCTAVMLHQPRSPPICYLPLSPPPSPAMLTFTAESYLQIAAKHPYNTAAAQSSTCLTPPVSASPHRPALPSLSRAVTARPAVVRNLTELIDAAATSNDVSSAAAFGRPARSLAGLLALQPFEGVGRPVAVRRSHGEKHRKCRMSIKPKKKSKCEVRPAVPALETNDAYAANADMNPEYERQFPPLPSPPSPRRPRPARPVRMRKGGRMQPIRKMRERKNGRC